MAQKKWIDKVTFSHLKRTDFYFRDFRGENKYNPKDTRPNFGIKLTAALADKMEKDGWPVKWTTVRDDAPEGVESIPYIKVFASFDGKRKPVVNMVIGKKVTQLDGDTIATLDGAAITDTTIRIRPYFWEMNGRSGVQARLDAMNVFVEEDELDSELRAYMEDEDDEDDEDAPF